MTVTREVHPRLKGGSSLISTVTKLVGTDLFKSSVTKASGRSARSDGYVRNIFQYLALFRFFSFSMGAGLVFVLEQNAEASPAQVGVMIAVGFYNALRVLAPYNPTDYRAPVKIIGAVNDVALGLILVLMTDGLDSAFLIYSLAPIMTVSLLMDVRSAIIVAAVSALSISGAYVAGGLGLGDYPGILEGNFLVFALLYSSVCFLVAAMPFLVNLNWERRVRSESIDMERKRLRREVHDNIAQTLAFLSLKVKRTEEKAAGPNGVISAKDVAEVARVVERAYLAVRDYLDGTENAVAEVGPFGPILAEAANQWSRDTGLPVETRVVGRDIKLSPKVQRQLVQIAREALANVAKHALPQHVWVTWENEAHESTLRVRDDGRGFTYTGSGGHGTNIMNERAGMVGATVDISSTPGQGTEVVVVYPHQEGEVEHE